MKKISGFDTNMTRKHEPSMYVCVLLLITHLLKVCFHAFIVKMSSHKGEEPPMALMNCLRWDRSKICAPGRASWST